MEGVQESRTSVELIFHKPLGSILKASVGSLVKRKTSHTERLVMVYDAIESIPILL